MSDINDLQESGLAETPEFEIGAEPKSGSGEESVIGDDGVEYIVITDEAEIIVEPTSHDANLADGVIPEEEMARLASTLIDKIDHDKDARNNRDKQYQEGLQRTGMGKEAPGGANFDGASKVVHPVLTECTVEFASSTIKELFPPNGPTRIKINGTPTAQKIDRAKRLRQHMNWQLTEQIPEFRYELEQCLTQLPMGGAGYIKLFYDAGERRPRAEFVPIDDIFIPFAASSIYTADRFTHRFVLTGAMFQARLGGLYRQIDYGTPQDPTFNESASELSNQKIEGKDESGMNIDDDREIYEVYLKEDLEGNGVRPYIVTIDVSSQKICSIYRNWDEDDDRYIALEHIIEFPFIPWRGAYPIGLPHIIGGLSAAATGALRALLDSAHVNNLPTAIRLKGSGASGQTLTLAPGTIPEIPDAGADDIRKVIMAIPFNQPSPMLYQLLGYIDEAARRTVGPIKAQLQDLTSEAPVGSMQSFIEAGSKVYSSVFARLHFSMARMMRVLARINRYYLDETDLMQQFGEQVVTKADYQGPFDLAPVSDPNIFSETQRYAQSQTIVQLMSAAPELYDARAVHYRVLNQAGIDNIDEILPPPEEPQDENPATENVKMLLGKPALALPDQDHLAHLQVLLDAVKSKALGSSPAFSNAFIPLAVDHAKQHIAYFYAAEMLRASNELTGTDTTLMPIDSADVRMEISKLLAGVSPEVVAALESTIGQGNEIIAAAVQFVQQNAPKPPIDPGTAAVMAQEMETKRLAQRDAADVQLDQQKMQSKEKVELAKLASMEQQNNQDNQTNIEVALIKEGGKVAQNQQKGMMSNEEVR